MSDAHTPGPFNERFDNLAGFESRDGLRTPVLLLEADYNRAKACWAACAGLETATLENLMLLGETLKSRFAARDDADEEAHTEFAALKAQRDELLAALKGTVFLFEAHAVTRTDMEQIKFARAAINKVEQQ